MRKIVKSRYSLMVCVGLVFCFLSGAQNTRENEGTFIDESILDGLKWRNIGPANMGGRIDDFAVVESNPNIVYAATASGGIWKTENNGVTWEPIFDSHETSTIGDITVAPSNPDVVWAGTGEPNNRQSSSWGNGVYKSTDGGKSWKNMGLTDTHHIGRIVIHPINPDIVYVAALGHLWGPNKERGLYRTTDGGKTWTNTKYIDENTGFVDVAIDHESPDTLYAAAYQRRRRGWGFNGGGSGSGLYKTTDGGDNWVRLTKGLPEGIVGRIGLDIYRKNSSIVYAIVEHKQGGIFRSNDKGFTWKKMSRTNPRPMYYSKIRIDPNNDQRIWVLGARMYMSEDGGKNFNTGFVTRIHGDHHAMWINPQNSHHMIVGSDGGIHYSYDRGKTWDFVNSLPLGQFYEIGFDMRKPYTVYGGLQDNGSWGGPSETYYVQGITNDEWIRIGGGDGFYTQVDPTDPDTIYAESQNGYLFRLNLKTGERKSIRPEPEDPKETYRFNWNCPIHISPHDPKTIYYGGNKLFISQDRGNSWEATIDLTKQEDREKKPLMDVMPDKNTLSKHDGIAYFGDITTIAESPVKKGLLYVGTDDGNLQVSKDGGTTWKNVTDKLRNVPQYTYVTRVVASHFAEGTAYATLDGHRNNDFKPYVFSTSDYGESWKDISSNIPVGSTVNVMREHHANPNLLFVGTERGAYFSVDRGKKWIKLKGNLPMVPVDDIAIHPRENDLILGTHGRSIWILDDITPLEQMTAEVQGSSAYLFDIPEATQLRLFYHKGNTGHKIFIAPNPPYGAMMSYYLKQKTKKSPVLVITDKDGQKVNEIKGSKNAGIGRVNWDLRHGAPEIPELGRTRRRRGPFVLPGEYNVTLKVEDQEMTKILRVADDPRIDISFADRKAQHDALVKLQYLYPYVTAATKAVEDLEKELENVQKTLKKVTEVPESIKEHMETTAKELGEIKIKLAGDPELGLSGRQFSIQGGLSMIGSSIEGYSEAPTDRQLMKIEKNQQELKTQIERINRIIQENIPRLNELLIANEIPHVFPVKIIKFNQR
ncbi:MAG: hypothetical protein JSV17_10815 [Candidatus Aminicenantes bacterium]|nr:MAG: hypothetical protein JSV17_10815 [Candidatus Aminicenantes bacterium]